MKIAKKVLAVAIAVGMIFCLTAMAFAGTPSVVLDVSEVDSDGYVSVTIALVDGVGAGAVKVDLTYDANVLEFDSDDDSACDTAQLKNCKSVDYKNDIGAVNGTTPGAITYGYAFGAGMQTADTYAADAARGKTVSVNDQHFTMTTLYFLVKDADAVSTPITIGGDIDGAALTGTVTVKLKDAPVEETTAAPVEETTAAPVEETTAAPVEETTAAPADEVTTAAAAEETTAAAAEETTAAPKGDAAPGTVNTGDKAVLAVAAGVCALAAAAFVVTKKVK